MFASQGIRLPFRGVNQDIQTYIYIDCDFVACVLENQYFL